MINPVIVITGASSGIGLAAARLFAKQGFRVVLAARRTERLISCTEDIRNQGGEALPLTTDVTKVDQIERLIETTIREYGRIDILFNNAGFGRLKWLELLDPYEDIELQLQVNILGVINTSRLVIPHMIKQQSGHIINMASIAGLIAPPTYSVYSASKFAVRGFTEALRRELNVFGIRVSGIYPGAVDTEFSQHAGRVHNNKRTTTPKILRLTSEKIAETVWRVTTHPRRMVIVPQIMVPVVWLNTIAPAIVDWGIRHMFTKSERGT
jgi:NADP-dependent 3-hydroxy acid dehydrogenase YdfG